jgi:Protein of unknown function (DUF3667)
MHQANCYNCGSSLDPQQKFCPQCGQNTDTHRLTIKHFLHEFFHAFTHADKGIIHLLKALATRPGKVAREYIAGKRKSYFNPFSFFLIMAGLFVLSNIYFKPPPAKIQPNPSVLARIPTENGKQKYLGMLQRINVSTGFMHTHGNVIAMIALPFVSLLTWLFYFKKRYNYAEHLTANIFFLTFSNLVFTLIVFPLQSQFKSDEFNRYFPFAAMALQAVYLSWCLNGFLELQTFGQRIKSALVSFLAIIMWFIFSLSILAIYIYQNKDFYKFFERMFSR